MNEIDTRVLAEISRTVKTRANEVRVVFLGHREHRSAAFEGRVGIWNFSFAELSKKPLGEEVRETLERVEESRPSVVAIFMDVPSIIFQRDLASEPMWIGIAGLNPIAEPRYTSIADTRVHASAHLDGIILPLGSEWNVRDLRAPCLSRTVLPVNDALFREEEHPLTSESGLFVGDLEDWSNHLLGPLKHHHQLTAISSGWDGVNVEDYSFGVSLQSSHYLGQLHNSLRHHAAGHLVLNQVGTSVKLPYRGYLDFFAGSHEFQFSSEHDLLQIVSAIESDPSPAQMVRIRGKAAAAKYRASVLWPRILGTVLLSRLLAS